MASPLASRLRPVTLDQVVGQKHLLEKGRVLRGIIDSGKLPNMIFFGPSGVGKTTVASILVENAGKTLHRLNGTSCSTADLKEIFAQINTFAGINGIVLYLDEIQYLSKKQQQTLLEFIEDGSVTLIASTTENPYFYIYNAILSRCTVFEFKAVEKDELRQAIQRAFDIIEKEEEQPILLEDGVIDYIASSCGGDVRKALNAVEFLAAFSAANEGKVSIHDAAEVTQRSAMRYDRDGDQHYDMLSAFQKSIRGSDENAALYYLARLLEVGDLLSVCRRLMVTAAEDIGLAYPSVLPIIKSCVDIANAIGLPEARIPLADGVILLCTLPKSNSGMLAIERAIADIKEGNVFDIPPHLKDAHYEGAKHLGRGLSYQYPHDFPHHYIPQQYLPTELQNRVYYQFGDNKMEQTALAYREKLKPKP